MKKCGLNVLFLALFVGFALISCDNNSNENKNGIKKGKIVLQMDGDKYEFTGRYSDLMEDDIGFNMIIGLNLDDKSAFTQVGIAINVPTNDINHQQLPLIAINNGGVEKYVILAVLTKTQNESWVATEGLLEITKKTDKTIQGTFSGNMAYKLGDIIDESTAKTFTGGFNLDIHY